jgi:peptide/nickel transport system substrate-binding protein
VRRPHPPQGLGEVSDDGLTWTYRLREDAVYEDGTPVLAQDIAHAVERSYDLAEWTYSPDSVSGQIEVPDDTTIEFHLGEPFAEFDQLMATSQTAPIPEDAAPEDTVPEEAGEEELEPQEIPATGPYRIAEYDAAETLVLEPNPEWDPQTDPHRAAGPERIEFAFAEEPGDLDDALRGGDLDADVSPGGLAGPMRGQVLDSPELLAKADAPYSGAVSYLALSSGVEPFDDPACRTAVREAVDREAAVEALGGEAAAAPAGSVLSPRDVGHGEVDPAPPDRDAAREALADCGHEEGFDTGLAVRGDVFGDMVLARSLAGDLAAVGIEVEIEEYSGEEFEETAADPDFAQDNELGLTVFTHRPWWPTGRFALTERVHGNWIRSSHNRNFSLWDDEHTDDLLGQAQEEHDEQARAELYGELDELLRDEAVLVPLAYPRTLLWRGKHLANVYAHPMFGAYDLATLSSTR